MLVNPSPVVIDGSVPRLRTLKTLALASVLAPLLLFLAYAAVSYSAAFRDAEARAAHIAGMLQEHAERVLETIALALSNARGMLANRTDEEIRTSRELWNSLRSIQAAGPQLGSIFVLGPDGTDLLNSRAFPAPAVDFSDRDYFLAQKDEDKGLYLGGAYIGKISHIPIFNFSIRRTYPDGRFAGVVGSSGFVDYFRKFYSTVGDIEDDFAVALVRSGGDVLVRYPTFQVGDKLDLSAVRPSKTGRQVGYMTSPLDGKQRLFATTQVGHFPAFVSYSVNTTAIRTQWAEGLIVPALLTVFGVAVLLSLSSLAIRRAQREGLAIRQLTETAHDLQRETERRQQAENSLLQAQKLDAIGRLTGGIAHDFNNLLTIILGNLTLAKKRLETSGAARLLEAAEEAAKRGATLTGQLLTFSRVQPLRPANVDLNEVLAAAKSWISGAVTEAIQINLETSPELMPVHVDVGQFEAALLNLVVNARDAMKGEGTLTIKSFVAHAPVDTPVSLIAGDYAAVAVSDRGSGIPADIVNKVFEPFFTTKPPGKGTGLGLSQVHGFVRQSGGDIAIDSKPREGTMITLFLPLGYRAEGERPLSTTQSGAQAKRDRMTVLVVEDEDEVRKLTADMLHELGHSILVCRTGSEALGLLSGGGEVDLVITDLVLPGMDGSALASEVTRRYPGVKVVLTTASLQFDNKAGYPVLRKPFSRQQVSDLLASVLKTERSLS
jgi:two-component system, NtrC family, sensor kinase